MVLGSARSAAAQQDEVCPVDLEADGLVWTSSVVAARAVSFEPCGASSTWSVRARTATVTKEDVHLDRPRLLLFGRSVGALPRLRLPRTRRTGLLPPEVAGTPARGATLAQPVFLALGPSHDLTAAPGVWTRRGPSFALESRSATRSWRHGLGGTALIDLSRDGRIRGGVGGGIEVGRMRGELELVSDRAWVGVLGPSFDARQQEFTVSSLSLGVSRGMASAWGSVHAFQELRPRSETGVGLASAGASVGAGRGRVRFRARARMDARTPTGGAPSLGRADLRAGASLHERWGPVTGWAEAAGRATGWTTGEGRVAPVFTAEVSARGRALGVRGRLSARARWIEVVGDRPREIVRDAVGALGDHRAARLEGKLRGRGWRVGARATRVFGPDGRWSDVPCELTVALAPQWSARQRLVFGASDGAFVLGDLTARVRLRRVDIDLGVARFGARAWDESFVFEEALGLDRVSASSLSALGREGWGVAPGLRWRASRRLTVSARGVLMTPGPQGRWSGALRDATAKIDWQSCCLRVGARVAVEGDVRGVSGALTLALHIPLVEGAPAGARARNPVYWRD